MNKHITYHHILKCSSKDIYIKFLAIKILKLVKEKLGLNTVFSTTYIVYIHILENFLYCGKCYF